MQAIPAKAAGFVMGSLLLHAGLYAWFGQGEFLQAGHAANRQTVTNQQNTLPVLQVAMIPEPTAPKVDEPGPTAPEPLPLVTGQPVAGLAPSAATMSRPDGLGPLREATIDLDQEYWPAGSLTRLPAPIDDIDLDSEGIPHLGFFGATILTILLDMQGQVENVIFTDVSDEARDFAERVAQRFKEARFRPGEIDGRPVKSRLAVTVVRENLNDDGE
jgi:hypothetical protein